MELSIIIPVYNSANILPELVKQIEYNLKDKISSFELFLVNDCSNDNSWNVIKELSSNYIFTLIYCFSEKILLKKKNK